MRRALSKLKLAMGAPQTLDFTVPPLLLSQQPPLVANVSVHEDLALGQRPDLKSLRETASAAAAGIDLAEAAHDLRVDLRLSTTWYEDNPLVDQNSWRVMGTLSKDLYTGQRMRSAVDRALETHVGKCPTAQSIKDSVAVTWSADIEVEA